MESEKLGVSSRISFEVMSTNLIIIFVMINYSILHNMRKLYNTRISRYVPRCIDGNPIESEKKTQVDNKHKKNSVSNPRNQPTLRRLVFRIFLNINIMREKNTGRKLHGPAVASTHTRVLTINIFTCSVVLTRSVCAKSGEHVVVMTTGRQHVVWQRQLVCGDSIRTRLQMAHQCCTRSSVGILWS